MVGTSDANPLKVRADIFERNNLYYLSPEHLEKFPVTYLLNKEGHTVGMLLSPDKYTELTRPITFDRLPEDVKQALMQGLIQAASA